MALAGELRQLGSPWTPSPKKAIHQQQGSRTPGGMAHTQGSLLLSALCQSGCGHRAAAAAGVSSWDSVGLSVQ